MENIDKLKYRGERYVTLAKYSGRMIGIGLALLVVVAIGEIAASGFPCSSLLALFGGYLDRDFSYVIGLLGDIVGSVLFWLGIAFKVNEDKGLMMLGIAKTYENTLNK